MVMLGAVEVYVNGFFILAPIILGPQKGPVVKMKVKFPFACHEDP
jgi:hypothetical protein